MYVYDFEAISLTNEQKYLLEMQEIDPSVLSEMVKELINKRVKDGWEPLYPFTFPTLWFRKGFHDENK
jgi:hypothetical protein